VLEIVNSEENSKINDRGFVKKILTLKRQRLFEKNSKKCIFPQRW
jgi:hypothetical protein